MVFPTPSQAAKLATALLGWFDENCRDLPWRRDRDPYRIWLSEIMLQQTQAVAVIPYFKRFVTRFPNLSSLACATESEVLHLWEGLGYYRRAKYLHRAAQILAKAHGNSPPADAKLWESLPGIGRYTLGAVLSQAYELPYPVLEANSRRVLARVALVAEDTSTSKGSVPLWELARKLLPATRVGDFNQAVMELGSLICTTTSPACERCPIRDWCQARLQERQHEIPTPRKPKSITNILEVAVAIRRDRNILLCRRSESGRWPGLWEFPRAEVASEETVHEASGRIAVQSTSISISDPREIASISHAVTRFRIHLTLVAATWSLGEWAKGPYVDHTWIDAEMPARLPCSAPQRKISKILHSHIRGQTLFDGIR